MAKLLAVGGIASSLCAFLGGALDSVELIGVGGAVMFFINLVVLVWPSEKPG